MQKIIDRERAVRCLNDANKTDEKILALSEITGLIEHKNIGKPTNIVL